MSITIFPSQNGWITPRAFEIQINSNNCRILLNQKIEKIDKLLVNGATARVCLKGEFPAPGGRPATNHVCEFSKLSTTSSGKNLLTQLDISRFIVDASEYNALPIWESESTLVASTKKYKNNTFYYEYGNNEIHLVNTDYKGATNIFSRSVTQCLLYSIAYYYIKNGGLWYINEGDIIPIEDIYTDFPAGTSDSLRMQFRVYYTPLGESVKLQVPKTNPQPNQFCIPYSQQQPIVDNVTFGREMQSVANRAGCEKREVVRTFGDIKDYRDPNDHWYYEERDASGKFTGNVWRLTGARLEIYRENMYRAVETWSKNWSYRSENVPINREFRSWNIPADVVQRNLLWQDYCLIKRVKEGEEINLPDNTLLSNIAKTEFMRGFDGSSDDKLTECTNMWFYKKTGSSSIKGAVMNCSAFGFGNSLVFSGKTKDNMSAGVQRVKSKDNDSNHEFCKDVYYCDDDGRLESLYVQFGAALTSPSADSAVYLYPECGSTKDGNENVTVNVPDSSNTLLFNEHEFNVQKDPSEQLNFTYQLHLLTDDGYLLIGSTLAANNPLVKERGKAQTVKVWKLSKYLPQGAQVMTSAYGTEQQNSDLYSVSIDSNSPSITFNPEGTINDGAGVCVTDENNAILIAFNGNKKAAFDVKFTHDYDAIAQALKKQNN